MHSCTHQRNEASTHNCRQIEHEIPESLLALAPTQESRFFLWLAFVEGLFEEEYLGSLCGFQRVMSRETGVAFLLGLGVGEGTPPFVNFLVELSLLHFEREVMEDD